MATIAVVAIVATGCGGGGGGEASPSASESAGGIPTGGVMKLATVADVQSGWDPAKEYEIIAWEVYRCCLLRTLYSYTGDADTLPKPDLAVDMPEVSADGLTYTVKIQQGIHYAPPFQDREITAPDFITAFGRVSDPQGSVGGYPFYFSVIEGFDDAKGDASKITGITSPDPYTLVFSLTQPTADFPYRLTMPATAPVPAEAAEGHIKDYGRFLVASGPYMWQGSEDMDFSVPSDQQKPVAGYDPNRAWILVRNPTWVAERDTDPLRLAYVDGFEIPVGGTVEDLANKVDAEEIDFVYGATPPSTQLQKYLADPTLQARVHAEPTGAIRYLSMNVAIPPFDDINVRRAVNYVVDKDGLRRARGGELVGDLAGHYIPDMLTSDLNASLDPYATPNGAGDLDKAKEEMKKSKYDSDGDGVCDDPVCDKILTITDKAFPYPEQNAILVDNLAQIGLNLDIRTGDRYTFMYAKCQDPNAHAAFCPSPGWGFDYAEAGTYGEPLFSSTGIGSSNYSLLGATPDQLKEWGYSVTEVPSVDDMVSKCQPLPVGDERVACWADLDKYLVEEVVPWVVWLFDNNVVITGPRVLNWTFDASAGIESLDHLALEGGGA
jgi:peptide/nickel transport system substrate-binding protein